MKKTRPPDDLTLFVIDQLRGLGIVEARRLFGGTGLYWNDRIFGLVDDGRLYFKVSPETRPRYEALGAAPWEPWPGQPSAGYFELPASVLEDADTAAAWARDAWAVPRTKKRVPRPKAGKES